MATRYNRRPVRRSAPRRNLFWARRTNIVTLQPDNLAVDVPLLSQFNTTYGANLFGFTVTRIRGHFTFWAPDSEDISATYRLSAGIRVDERVDSSESNAIADEDAEQVAKAPFNDPYSDWMYVRNCLGITDSAQTHSSTREAAENRVEVDIKAQRKLSELNERLYLMLETSHTAEVGVWYDLHVLLKQP